MKSPSLEDILWLMEDKGYPIWDDPRGYDLNLVGVRSDDMEAGTFNDFVGCFYKQHGSWVYMMFPATTDPGVKYREEPMNVKGAAILQEGYHPGMWTLGMHRGAYPAFVQYKAVPVYRDNNKDAVLDTVDVPVDVGKHGINLHRAHSGRLLEMVGPYSAGCQVVQASENLGFLVKVAQKAVPIYGPTYGYGLLLEEDF